MLEIVNDIKSLIIAINVKSVLIVIRLLKIVLLDFLYSKAIDTTYAIVVVVILFVIFVFHDR